MNNKESGEIHFIELLDSIGPNIQAIIFLSKEKLTREIPYFNELNYLFDGLISTSLYRNEKSSDDFYATSAEHFQMFATQNFNQNLYLIHFLLTDDIEKKLEAIMQFVDGNKKDKDFFVINLTEFNLKALLAKKYPNKNFIFNRP